jgi:hypothetical protein
MRFDTPMRFLFLLSAVTGIAHLASANTNPASKPSKEQHSTATVSAAKPSSSRGAIKYVICHKGHEISVAASAVPAHLAHGDSQGSCAPSNPSNPGQGL